MAIPSEFSLLWLGDHRALLGPAANLLIHHMVFVGNVEK